ncbi:hemolysin family protein [Caldalkalibacillus salinus]|uniref:hemolysin family protein n=1 Tax=Caldalkalibacillus salinus TaxID=2803787 RepID=UPI00192470E2|nr:hemolysin family protein [Caldalkalibacillus salinus]
MIIINLILVAILIIFTAFFVAAEFAVVKIRSTRIEQLADEGNKRAQAAKKVLSNLDGYLSACQLGITITALGLGWLGEPTVERMLNPLFHDLNLPSSVSHILSFAIAFITITFLHVVIGELAPKTVAIQKAEKVTLLLSPPLILFYKLMYPFIWALNGSARFFVGLFGLQPASEHEVVHSEEELRIILTESYQSGEINQSEYHYVNKIFEFDNRIAREVMVPRTEMITISLEDDIEGVLRMAQEKPFTRYPVMDNDKDTILGMVNIKEVLKDHVRLTVEEIEPHSLNDYVRPVIEVLETIPIHDLLIRMQKERRHLAILIDEYGGTSGLVTVEDILEEIVGEIQDEFDVNEKPRIVKKGHDHYIFDGKVLVTEVNEVLGIHIEAKEIDTIGGWVLTQNMNIKEGQKITYGHYEFKALKLEGHHVQTLEVKAINT